MINEELLKSWKEALSSEIPICCIYDTLEMMEWYDAPVENGMVEDPKEGRI
ncbi:MAG: hypothetical protein ACPLKX_09230 [Dictyoglomaceae bacterium]